MRTIPASQFKQHCLQILDTVDEEGIVITKRGKPVAKLTAIDSHETSAHLIGSMKGMFQITDDLFSTGVEWSADGPEWDAKS